MLTPYTNPTDAMLQFIAPQPQPEAEAPAPDPRGRPPLYRPFERQQFDLLAQAIARGMDPNMAAQIGAGLDQTAYGRLDARQARQQAIRSDAADALMQIAMTNPDPAAGQTYLDSVQSLHPRLNTGRLEDYAGTLYPGGGTSPMYAAPEGEGMVVTPDDIAGVWADAISFATGDPEKGTPPVPLHQARMLIIGQLRAQGYPEAEIAKAYDAVGQAYSSVGGSVGNTPITSEDRLAQVAARTVTPITTPRPVPQDPRVPITAEQPPGVPWGPNVTMPRPAPPMYR